MAKKPDGAKSVEVLPPSSNGGQAQIYAEIAAQITQYTDRPDLFLEVIEKHDPGFIKQMNESAKDHAKRTREQRFNFGKTQAYVALCLAVVAALLICASLFFLMYLGRADFWSIIALGIFYAITQGGSKGFSAIVSGFSSLIADLKSKFSSK